MSVEAAEREARMAEEVLKASRMRIAGSMSAAGKKKVAAVAALNVSAKPKVVPGTQPKGCLESCFGLQAQQGEPSRRRLLQGEGLGAIKRTAQITTMVHGTKLETQWRNQALRYLRSRT
eukprot:CAMPEP_0119308842 /NCGR_PEP_ID=MMETSP1333-20130426/12802_1 /TAXON_ID=418940 /ORGANISM="Scyphosphaera apsteinii, Strain RCC1455" /LENGTH=118 /DNA_ID=CAMNT_0007312707 /DNA_START=12 /DNA_END=368 /DNA_ORIENTATION=+